MVAVIDWRPIRGCSLISIGCEGCPAMKSAPKWSVTQTPEGPVWNGKVRFRLDAADLDKIGSAVVLVCSYGDAFHHNVPDTWLDAIFAEIEARPYHQAFVLITKRSARMRAYVSARYEGRPPPGNLHLGIAAERQQEAGARLADLRGTPAARRFAQFYPVLGPIAPDLAGLAYALSGSDPERPAEKGWLTGLARACAAAGVPLTQSNEMIEP